MHQKDVQTHFAFGKNWASYAELIGEHEIEEAKKALRRLIPVAELKAHSFLDIGCGSGLHALAAAELGANRILAIDIDPDSVATSKAVLSRKNIQTPWRVETMSVFDLNKEREGVFDIVYSWACFITLATCGKRSAKPRRWLRQMDCLSLRYIERLTSIHFGNSRNVSTLTPLK
jgi:2-polyprenyl-3-methyl-5-hydroxy-6-metoxy-1,4-benzoquinol methylase